MMNDSFKRPRRSSRLLSDEDPTSVTSEAWSCDSAPPSTVRRSLASWTDSTATSTVRSHRRLQDRRPANRKYDSQTSPTPNCTPRCAKPSSASSRPRSVSCTSPGREHRTQRHRRGREGPLALGGQCLGKINRFYDDGDFPATPSVNACRFCSYKDLCRANGVAVPV